MHRQDLLRALARRTGESINYLKSNGFQFHQRFPHPINLPDLHKLHRSLRRCRPPRRLRYMRSY